MYLLDANVFIQAKNRYYDPAFCPAFWDYIEQLYNNGKVFSIDKVKDEIMEGHDDLLVWIRQLNNDFFIKTDESVIDQFGKINNWLYQQSYQASAIQSFQEDAYYYLIARTLANKETVIVTQEVVSDSKKKAKIPNVCIGLEIQYCSTFQMLRREKAKFILDNTGS